MKHYTIQIKKYHIDELGREGTIDECYNNAVKCRKFDRHCRTRTGSLMEMQEDEIRNACGYAKSLGVSEDQILITYHFPSDDPDYNTLYGGESEKVDTYEFYPTDGE
jgi:hypothetical protein